MNAILEEIKPETARRLAELARAKGESIDEYVRNLLPPDNALPEQSQGTIGERLERKGLLGTIDSSVPDDSASPPRRSLLYQMIADKYRKQGLNLP